MYYFFIVSSIFLSEILISDINHVPLPALFSLIVLPGFNLLKSLKVLKKDTLTSIPIENPVKVTALLSCSPDFNRRFYSANFQLNYEYSLHYSDLLLCRIQLTTNKRAFYMNPDCMFHCSMYQTNQS